VGDEVALDKRQDHFGEELDVLAGGLEGGLAREAGRLFEWLHVDGGFFDVLEKLLQKVVGEFDLD